jgi:hypothetical protein
MKCHCGKNQFVCYTDTDSIVTPSTMVTGTALGELKDEYPNESGKLRGLFLGPKVYILSTKKPSFPWEGDFFETAKAKGIERRDRETVELLAAGGTVFQKRLEKVGTLGRENFGRGPRMVTVPKRMLVTDGKRVIHEDGSTSPHKLSMW